MQTGSRRISVDFNWLETVFSVRLLRNKRFKLQLNRELEKYMRPYVPAESGDLALARVTPSGVIYDAPYAHYQYTGVVYGPNIWMMNYETLEPEWASKSVEKYPTGDELGDETRPPIIRTWDKKGRRGGPFTRTYVFGYTKDYHPLATHHWDKRMMEEEGDSYIAAITPYVMQNIRKRGRSISHAR